MSFFGLHHAHFAAETSKTLVTPQSQPSGEATESGGFYAGPGSDDDYGEYEPSFTTPRAPRSGTPRPVTSHESGPSRHRSGSFTPGRTRGSGRRTPSRQSKLH